MSTQAHDGLNQHTWKLSEMGLIGAPRPISPEFTITPQFEEESRIHGASACNRYFATYHLNGPHLEFQYIGATRMMCPEPAMVLESDYFAALEKVKTYQLQEDRSTLYYNQGKNLLLFRKREGK
jgi:heat shock protein HslJ